MGGDLVFPTTLINQPLLCVQTLVFGIQSDVLFLFICGVSFSESVGPQSSQLNTPLVQSHESTQRSNSTFTCGMCF